MKKAAQEGKKDPTSCPKFQCAFEEALTTQSAHSATQVSAMKGKESKNKRRKHKQPSPPAAKEVDKLPQLFEFKA